MGTACDCIGHSSGFDTGNWISLAAICVNSILAIWIVKTIQYRLTNKRVLKDHLINEVKDIRSQYTSCLSNLYSSATMAKNVIPWFKLMNIKIEDLMKIINEKYGVDKKILDPYQNELRDIITENRDFIKQYEALKPVVFTDNSKSLLMKFQQTNNHLFNTLIIKINDAK